MREGQTTLIRKDATPFSSRRFRKINIALGEVVILDEVQGFAKPSTKVDIPSRANSAEARAAVLTLRCLNMRPEFHGQRKFLERQAVNLTSYGEIIVQLLSCARPNSAGGRKYGGEYELSNVEFLETRVEAWTAGSTSRCLNRRPSSAVDPSFSSRSSSSSFVRGLIPPRGTITVANKRQETARIELGRCREIQGGGENELGNAEFLKTEAVNGYSYCRAVPALYGAEFHPPRGIHEGAQSTWDAGFKIQIDGVSRLE
ncbi:hypothetical protein FB451DRAFT_1163639 [Mycena latifolia]|nr:hypothetical protein FB451DRAFT_1163639 [Mycena latifolia]